jgi:hypothetical protein
VLICKKYLLVGTVILISGCQASYAQDHAPLNNSTQEVDADDERAMTLCNGITNLHKSKLLDTVVIKDDHIDVDNDGTKEKLAYLPAGKTEFLFEIRDGRRYTLPTGSPDAHYSGSKMIAFRGKNYLLHFSSLQPSELAELARESANGSVRFKTKVLCDFKK